MPRKRAGESILRNQPRQITVNVEHDRGGKKPILHVIYYLVEIEANLCENCVVSCVWITTVFDVINNLVNCTRSRPWWPQGPVHDRIKPSCVTNVMCGFHLAGITTKRTRVERGTMKCAVLICRIASV